MWVTDCLLLLLIKTAGQLNNTTQSSNVTKHNQITLSFIILFLALPAPPPQRTVKSISLIKLFPNYTLLSQKKEAFWLIPWIYQHSFTVLSCDLHITQTFGIIIPNMLLNLIQWFLIYLSFRLHKFSSMSLIAIVHALRWQCGTL